MESFDSRTEGYGHEVHSARELLAGVLGNDPYERIDDLRQAGERWAEKVGVSVQLEHLRQVVLSRLKNEYEILLEKQEGKSSEAKLERLARADEKYELHLERMARAQSELRLAESEYWAIRSELEWDRAAVAHYNAMSKLEEPAP